MTPASSQLKCRSHMKEADKLESAMKKWSIKCAYELLMRRGILSLNVAYHCTQSDIVND